MPYRAPLADLRAVLSAVGGTGENGRIVAGAHFPDLSAETVEAVLTAAARLSEDTIAPVQRAGDTHPAVLEGGRVRTSPGFAEAYRAIRDGGWIGMTASPEAGGMGLPRVLSACVNEMLAGACLSLQLNPLLTQGAIAVLEAHAAPGVRALFLPPLVRGDWSATMNLTEAQAGSDVGALATRAERDAEGHYRITGEKIFITWADTDFTENVCHLVLARLPDAPAGTRGISLFLVPRQIPGPDGSPGEANALTLERLEHKLGLHGSPTAVVRYAGARGWLVGEEAGGMRAMFTMMNDARLGVGIEGVGQGEAALQLAVDYARTRRQGATATGEPTIIGHDDVRRMLATMKADVQAARGIALMCAGALDRARDRAHATGAAAWEARAALLTPIAKTFGSETGFRTASDAIQVLGGTGYIEETGAAQYLRDARVTAIYEGTNGIQAMDLAVRKLADEGRAALALLDEITAGARGVEAAHPDLSRPLLAATGALRAVVNTMLTRPREARGAGAAAFLSAFARVLGGHVHLRLALCEPREGRHTRLARFYMARLLPRAHAALAEAATDPALLRAVTAGDPGA